MFSWDMIVAAEHHSSICAVLASSSLLVVALVHGDGDEPATSHESQFSVRLLLFSFLALIVSSFHWAVINGFGPQYATRDEEFALGTAVRLSEVSAFATTAIGAMAFFTGVVLVVALRHTRMRESQFRALRALIAYICLQAVTVQFDVMNWFYFSEYPNTHWVMATAQVVSIVVIVTLAYVGTGSARPPKGRRLGRASTQWNKSVADPDSKGLVYYALGVPVSLAAGIFFVVQAFTPEMLDGIDGDAPASTALSVVSGVVLAATVVICMLLARLARSAMRLDDKERRARPVLTTQPAQAHRADGRTNGSPSMTSDGAAT